MFDNLDDTRPTIPVLVDGDIVAYKCAAAADGRCWSWSREGSKVKIQEKYKKDATEKCVSLGVSPAFLTETFNPDPVEFAIHSVKLSMERIREDVEAEFPGYKADLKVYLTGKTNFRNLINPSYKSNRDGMRRPHHLSACKEYLTGKYGAVTEEGYEADDLIGIEAELCLEYGSSCACAVVATIDKDLQMIPACHYHLDKQAFTYVDSDQADCIFYKQVLTGDVTDGIISLKGVGPKTAEKQMSLVGELYESRYEAALALFFKYTPRLEGELVEDYVDRVECIFYNVAQLIWIRRSRDEGWSV